VIASGSTVPPALAVSPTDLRRAAAALLNAATPLTVPGSTVDAPWAVGAALPAVIAATADHLAALAAYSDATADLIRAAADSYERCDSDVADRIRAALRGRYA
jgi:hypothetical protein